MHEGRALLRNGEDKRFTDQKALLAAAIVTFGMVLDTGKDRSQDDGDEGSECGKRGDLGKCIECPWQGANPGDDCGDRAKTDGADRAIGHCVQILGANEDMQTLRNLSTYSKTVEVAPT